MKFAVLGAGISGLSVARILKDKGHDVKVYEKNMTIGGLARSRFTNGILYDPHGGHIFNSKHAEVMKWAFSVLEKDNWNYVERNAKIYFEGKLISYPFELSLYELETDHAVNCVYDFIISQRGKEPNNYRDWLIWNFGEAICKYYMIPYNEKIWSYPLENIGTNWIRGKMPLPSKREIIRSLILKDSSERKMVHSTFYYPLRGGIQTFVNAIAENIEVICGDKVEKIESRSQKWFINGDGAYDHIISTLPLPLLPNVMDVPSRIELCIQKLKYNSLTTILFECDKTDITWLYIPSHKYRSHRVGYQGTLTPYACNREGKSCAALELIGKKYLSKNDESNNNILPEEIGFEKELDSEFTEYAYPIFDIGYSSNIKCIHEYFKNLNGFDLLGRWGCWNYNNMDQCILDAMHLVDKYDV